MTRPILYISGPYSAGNGRTVVENIAVARAHAEAAARAPGVLPDLAARHDLPGTDDGGAARMMEVEA